MRLQPLKDERVYFIIINAESKVIFLIHVRNFGQCYNELIDRK